MVGLADKRVVARHDTIPMRKLYVHARSQAKKKGGDKYWCQNTRLKRHSLMDVGNELCGMEQEVAKQDVNVVVVDIQPI